MRKLYVADAQPLVVFLPDTVGFVALPHELVEASGQRYWKRCNQTCCFTSWMAPATSANNRSKR